MKTPLQTGSQTGWKLAVGFAVVASLLATSPLHAQKKSSSSTKSKTSTKTTKTTKSTKSTTAAPAKTDAPATPAAAPAPSATPAAAPSPAAAPTTPTMPTKTGMDGKPVSTPVATPTPSTPVPLTQSDAADGIREALSKGIGKAVEVVSQTNGYFGNPLIKIPFPPEAKAVEDGVRRLGLGKEADRVVESLNRAAENAASEALPIFGDAIKSLTLSDALAIVQGTNERAATDFLQRTTSKQLAEKFKPVIQSSLDKVDATKYWGTVINTYNKIPLVQKMNPDLSQYVTDRALEGLFTMVAQEEKEIRKNPVARTTDLLKKVFDFKF